MAALVLVQPTLAALACPRCFGFEHLFDNVFVDKTMGDEDRARLSQTVVQARRKVAQFFGVLNESPVVLACASVACTRRFGSGDTPAGDFYATFALRLSPRGLDDTIKAHELSHIELHRQLGLVRFLSGAVPAWFDEGIAVIIADDRRYVLPVGGDDRSRVSSDGELPNNMRDRMRAASVDHDLYARAACRVIRWMQAHGGEAALLALIDQVAAGKAFDQLYRDPPKP